MKSYWQINRYNHVAVETADQKELILICYDEAIRALQQGVECYLQKQFEEKARLLIRAQNFITELMVSFESGGRWSDCSKSPRPLWFFHKEHIQADIKGDMQVDRSD